MEAEKNEVKVINIYNDGHRLICEDHYNYIKENKLKLTLDLIYGKREERKYENKNVFRRPNWNGGKAQDARK